MKKVFIIGTSIVLIVLFAAAFWIWGLKFISSPDVIKYPELTHYHFRIQYFKNGNPVNFADSQYQETYEKGQCSDDLPATPIHFHDNKTQIAHVHWNKLTGGMWMKYYGNNLIGGSNEALGYRFDSFPNLTEIKIHTNALPKAEGAEKYWVYIGDTTTKEDGSVEVAYEKKSLEDFLNQDFETFFGKQSKFNREREEAENFSSILLNKAKAHGGEKQESKNIEKISDNDTNSTNESNQTEETQTSVPTQEELEEIQDILGHVVIFVQESEPNSEAIQNAFKNLEPLEPSTCGG